MQRLGENELIKLGGLFFVLWVECTHAHRRAYVHVICGEIVVARECALAQWKTEPMLVCIGVLVLLSVSCTVSLRSCSRSPILVRYYWDSIDQFARARAQER